MDEDFVKKRQDKSWCFLILVLITGLMVGFVWCHFKYE